MKNKNNDFDLSEKIQYDLKSMELKDAVIIAEDVKEFVKQLKRELKKPKSLRGYHVQSEWFKEILDRLVGDKLI